MKLKELKIVKRDGSIVDFDVDRIERALKAAFKSTPHHRYTNQVTDEICKIIELTYAKPKIHVEDIQNEIEYYLMNRYPNVAQTYIKYRHDRNIVRASVEKNKEFIKNYSKSQNTADSTVDDNSNVSGKNIGVLNSEIHKGNNIETSRAMITDKLRQLFPDMDAKQYVRDITNHIIYKNDESSFCGPIAPYCVSSTMYPLLLRGIEDIGGLSAAPKNLDSFCGIYVNYVFAESGQFAGAVATSEFLLYFDYFARKEWGNDYYKRFDESIYKDNCANKRTIQGQIHQYFQQTIYSINQPSGARGMQSAFVNFSYFDKSFFEGMFGDFYFPDGTQPQWDSLNWLQKDFMMWFNNERSKCVLTFPVESFALVYKDGKFEDEENAKFIAEEYARGHSFFTYISDTVDSLSSCCRLKNMVQTKEFNFTNGNMGVQTGSKSVITLNLSRIIQDTFNKMDRDIASNVWKEDDGIYRQSIIDNIENILKRVYRYHIAYNECLWDMYDSGLLPVYKAGFIDLNKQYLTIGLNGLNQAAEYLGLTCNNNERYKDFCQLIFRTIKECNARTAQENNGKFNGHKITFNTEQVPAESLAAKNYNWDKEDGYWVPEDTNLYASYIFKPNDPNISIFDMMIMHGKDFSANELDGGMACHINLQEHLSVKQYEHLLDYAGKVGCSYFTFNIPMVKCEDCGHIHFTPVEECPNCKSTNLTYYTRIIGYLTAVKHWSKARREEFKLRVFHKPNIE